MNVLVVDIGGSHVKILATGQKQSREFPSGPQLSARQMVAGVKKVANDWRYEAVSIGHPGVVVNTIDHLRNRGTSGAVGGDMTLQKNSSAP
jgi:polyphosphate glucokinase